jgi:hypothetical protein
LECAHQKHSIFLSHSGAQKAFVRRLRKALKSNAYLPFFDEDPDCLPKGEPFAHRIKDMCQLADVAVVVLSDEFFKRKWPMIELAIFIQEQRRRISVQESKELKVLPLFMGLSIEEFRSAERQICWLEKWNEFGATDSRIDISEWKQAVKVLGGTNGLEYCRYKTEEEYIDSIVEAIFKLVSPDFMWDDTHMKGRSKFHQVFSKLESCQACSSKNLFYLLLHPKNIHQCIVLSQLHWVSYS